jgi:hypothetical protein
LLVEVCWACSRMTALSQDDERLLEWEQDQQAAHAY